MRRTEREQSDGSRGERRFWATLAVAVTLHAGLAWVVHRESRARPVAKRNDSFHLHFFDVSLLAPGPNDVVPEQRRTENDSVVSPETTPVASRGPESKPAPPRDAATIAAVSPPVVTNDAAGVASADAPRPRAGLSFDALGIGASNPFLGVGSQSPSGEGEKPGPAPVVDPNEAANKTRAAERRLERSMVTAMLDHDRAAGASRSGPLATALEEAAMLVASPVTGQAEFVATVDATGLVAALRPVRVSSRASDWQHVAAEALKKLAKKRVRVPAGSAGLEVRLLLSSRNQLPSGASAGGAVSLHQIPLVQKGDGWKLSRLEPSPESNRIPDSEIPGSTGAGTLQQAVPMGGIDGDLADIGGISRRVVHVTITNERPL